MLNGSRRTARRIKSIETGFRAIRVLEGADGYLPLTRIAALGKMSVSKAYVYLNSFMHEGMVAQDPVTGHYGLGPFAAQLGVAAIRGLDVVGVSRGEVDALAARTGCAVSLALWSNRGPTILVKADGEGQGSMTVRLGHVLSPRGSASGLVFQAFLPEAEVSPVLAAERPAASDGQTRGRTRGSNAAARRALLARVRKQGYAGSDRGPHAGFSALAAPVFDYSSAMVAALAVLGPSAAFDARGGGVRGELLAAAARVSAKLGYVARETGNAAAGQVKQNSPTRKAR